MSFGILRRFLNPSASNNKCIGLRRFLSTASSDSIPIHNGNGKLEGGSQCTALIPFSQCRDVVHKGGSQFRDAVSIQDEIDKELGRTGILVTLAGICLYLADEEIVTKPVVEERRRKLLKNLPRDRNENMEFLYKLWRERSEKYKIKEEQAAKAQKLLLEELEELMENLKRDENSPNIKKYR